MDFDEYNTIKNVSEGLYKEKGSKFIALAFHVETVDECKEQLANIKKQYHDARHHCYAYRINPENEESRSNDDGEPSGSAGKPIMNQILSFELYNVMVVVVRYFGGTKLGVSGLINAYKTSTRMALEEAKISKSFITSELELFFDYPLMNDVMRIIKDEDLNILGQYFTETCVIKISVKKLAENELVNKLEKLYKLDIKRVINN